MKFRLGAALGFLIGYVLGARAGRQRYLQMTEAARRMWGSDPVTGTTAQAAEKFKAVASLGLERMKDTIGVRLGWRNGDQAADAIALDLAEDLATALNSRRRLPDRRMSPDRRSHSRR